MDLIIPKKALLRLLTHCQGVADKKSAMPALANVLLTTEGASLRVSATDLYLAVSGTAGCDVSTKGSVAVPAKDLFERVKAMPDGPLQILANDACATTLKAVGAPRRYTIHGIPGREFPLLPVPPPDARPLALPPALLASAIARTAFAISTDESRPHVNSLCVETRGDRVVFVATDGHRLAKTEATIAGLGAAAGQMLVTIKGVSELRKLLDAALADKEAPVDAITLTLSGPNVFFELAGVRFSVKLVDAQFPPYQQVIPETTAHSARVPRVAVAEAARAVAVAAGDKTGGVKFTFSPGVLRVSSESADHGSGFDQVAIDYSGPEVAVGVQPKYVLDALGAVDGDEVLLGFGGELDPVVVRPSDEPDGQSYVCVIMPMRI